MRPNAFTLIELSIVLVILGLLAGGILAGKSLIRASELRSVTQDLTRYQTAVSTFRDKYFGLPGDITNATAIWGKDTTSASACAAQSGNAGTPGTCNGNGNGQVDAPGTEWTRFWQQLGMAGLIAGQYSGAAYGWFTPQTIGVDFPASHLPNTGYTAYYASQSNNGEFGNNILPDISYNWFLVGGATTTGFANAPVLKVEEAWNIDTKLDDGYPFTGKIHAGQRSVCGVSAGVITSAYAVNNTGLCVIGYIFN